jgi:hypothetical protein
MIAPDLIAGIWGLSLCLWGLFNIYTIFRIERFIVKRYEQETDLLNTDFFANHVPFVRYLPNFFSSAIYNGHLMMCVWGWRYFRTKKVFRDIKESTFVTQHFTEKEIRKVKRFGISLVIIILHGIAYCIFRFTWPKVFN